MNHTLAIFLLLVIPLFVLGLSLVVLARWARSRGEAFRVRHPDAKPEDWITALQERRFVDATNGYLFGPLPRLYERLGKFLALAVIVLIVSLACLLLYLLATRT